MANAAQRAKLQQKGKPSEAGDKSQVAGGIKPVTPAEVPPAKGPQAEKQTESGNAKSIRSTIMSMITDGKSTKEISDVLKEQFPGSKAAEKSSKHISFYRSRMKKDATEKAEAK